MSSAARTARSASSSWSRGTPNTAITASPMNFSTTPPWRCTAACIASKYRAMTRRNSSGSSRSPRPVKPATSVNTTVTTFRAPAAMRSSQDPRAAPQRWQNLAESSFWAPHSPHPAMCEVYVRRWSRKRHRADLPDVAVPA